LERINKNPLLPSAFVGLFTNGSNDSVDKITETHGSHGTLK
jgi:hypothetical protein